VADAHVQTVKAALEASLDAEGILRAWTNDGRPGGTNGLRKRLEDAADALPVEEAVRTVRAAGAASVK
jgi:hypothetical protein